MNQKPNFIYIGTSKAGSTWLFDLLSRHPDAYMTPVKGLYFFDTHFDKGWLWYTQHFAEASGQAIVGEISHSYLYSKVACQRIAEMNPDIQLMVCLREPIDRAFSMYLDGIRNDKWTGTFEQRCLDTREILEEGCYARYLQPYLERFSREQVHIALFDDLKQSPRDYAAGVFDALRIPQLPWDPRWQSKVMPACVPRNKHLAQFSKQLSQACRRMGLKKIRGRVKRSRVIRSLLYRNVEDKDRAQVSPEFLAELKQRFQPEVERLDEMLGMDLCRRWGYLSRSASVEHVNAARPNA
ncbi:sulfotransferase domain-containing protein [Roseimaritima ulvae]|uniref:Sulfotransferase domain protein n=1 Tax=Roseimaritima ulvae TaxID=980254 RepID=A0A5B9QXP6_9BACT|nr:sulfotransferase domain-containing protein [Roseimaritima ulvae]QEG41896.1 Sulfotransferase domain protein [Roseimaritima ulvae]